MKKIIILFLFGFILYPFLSAQKCEFYYPQNKGVELVYKNYDKKGKLTGTSSQKVTDYKETSTGAEATIVVKTTDDKGKTSPESKLNVKCEAGVFYFDMKGYLNQDPNAYQGMEVKMDALNLEMPSSLKAGDKLKDGWVKMDVSSGGMKIMSMEVDITDRTVEGKENVTTPAGTFDCLKISQKATTKMGMKIESKTTQWMCSGTGMIKTETYSSDGKLAGSTVLEAINK
jgi:hypothetical protein